MQMGPIPVYDPASYDRQEIAGKAQPQRDVSSQTVTPLLA